MTIEHDHTVNEVFLDDVRVPAENLVGEPDSGWQQARFLLGNERTHNAYVGMLKRHLLRIAKLIEAAPARGVTPFAQAQYWRAHALLEIDVDALEGSEEHTSEHQSLMRISYAVLCLDKKNQYRH